MVLYCCYPSAPEFRNEHRRNFGIVSADNPEEAFEVFREFIGANHVNGFVAREMVDDDSFMPFLIETSHVPVGEGYGELTSGGDRI